MLGLQHGGEEEGTRKEREEEEEEGGIKFADAPSSPPSNKKQKDAAKTVRRGRAERRGARRERDLRVPRAKSATTPQSQDIKKKISKCKEEKSGILDLSKMDVPWIEELYLYGNRISTLPQEISHLKKLKTLAVNENNFASLPDELASLSSLQVLDLRHNKLKDLPPVVFQLPSLNTLFLRFNKVKTIGPELGNLKALTTLSLRENKIKDLPPQLGELTQLTALDVSHNSLQRLPDGIDQALCEPSVPGSTTNNLTALPDSVDPAHLSRINSLCLEHNAITKVPLAIFSQATQRQSQHASQSTLPPCPLTWVPPGPRSLNLTSGANQLTALPEDIQELTRLESLLLCNNLIRALPKGISASKEPEVGLLCCSERLQLIHVSWSTFVNSPKLNVPFQIDLCTSLTEATLENLEELYLNDNPNLQSLPYELALCKRLAS
eukprot:Em0017g45a